jgi:hypothetical protein
MVRDRDMHDTASLVREDDEDEQKPARGRRHNKEVRRHDLLKMIREERSPRLRWRLCVSAADVLGDGRLRHNDAQLDQFAVNPRRSP